MMKALAHCFEAVVARFMLSLFSMMSLDRASAIGGGLARMIGPRLSVSRTARRNLGCAFPRMSADEIEAVVRGMWENLGRVIGEYPHIGKLDATDPDGRIEVVGVENIKLLRDDQKCGILFSAHLGNWEIIPLTTHCNDLQLTAVYRPLNNPYLASLLRDLRARLGGVYVPKGANGAKKLIQALRCGDHITLLMDQKFNQGIPVPFFGRDAMTAPALAQLALKFDCPVVPIRVERLGGAYFRLTAYPPLTLTNSGNRQADIAAALAQINAMIEDWVRARPEQWFWLHNRWPD